MSISLVQFYKYGLTNFLKLIVTKIHGGHGTPPKSAESADNHESGQEKILESGGFREI